jgi:nitroreductase
MKKIDPYPAIFKRKSIRNYDLAPLDKDTLNEISEHISALKPLDEHIQTELKIISLDEVKQRMMKKAPHYIAAFSQNKSGYLNNIGFMLQQMDLYLSANGIGCCWQGIPQPTKEVLKSSNLEFVILMAFGRANEPLHRTSVSQFKRKPLKKITDLVGVEELLEPVRLAPSATNSQPWFFSGAGGLIHVYSVKPNFLRSLLAKKYIPIDMGIALYHLKISGEHLAKKIEIIRDKTAKDQAPKGYKYVASAKIEQL